MISDNPRISVVIPAFNRRDSVLELLSGLVRQEGIAFEVILVDDCSPDDTAIAVERQFPSVRVLRNPTNGGPAVSRNAGARAARGEIVVGFDSDVTVTDPELLRKVDEIFAREPGATGLAFRLLTPDGAQDDSPRWWHPLPIERFSQRTFPTDYFSGTGYAFRRDAMIAAGLYPEILYMHYEEVELAYRILDAGGTILYTPEIEVRHHAHPVAQRSKIKVFYKPRNQVLVALACLPWSRAVYYLAPRLVYNLGAALRHGHAAEFFAAMASAWRLAPRRLADRAPLRPDTWRRIAALRNPPAESRAGHSRPAANRLAQNHP